ncbi:hypothetical protein VNI00_015610, partial [Paramarasmius palmivorus]
MSDNIALNWTWYPDDPIDISIALYDGISMCSAVGKAPIAAEGIIYIINVTNPNPHGQKHGFCSFTVNNTG